MKARFLADADLDRRIVEGVCLAKKRLISKLPMKLDSEVGLIR
jgi:hypothetical protein